MKCFTSSIVNESIEAIGGQDSTEFGDVITFGCSKGYEGDLVEYNCTASGILQPVNGNEVTCSSGTAHCVSLLCLIFMCNIGESKKHLKQFYSFSMLTDDRTKRNLAEVQQFCHTSDFVKDRKSEKQHFA